jgi:hypothetical protein
VTARSLYRGKLDQLKHDYYKAKIENSDNDRKMFQIVDEISGCNKMSANILPDVELSLIPDLFANFFVNKITQIRSKLTCNTVNDTVTAVSNLSSFLHCQLQILERLSLL